MDQYTRRCAITDCTAVQELHFVYYTGKIERKLIIITTIVTFVYTS